MTSNFVTVTGTMEYTTSTGSVLKYTYTKSGPTFTIVRHFTPGLNNAPMTIEDILNDAGQLQKIANGFRQLARV